MRINSSEVSGRKAMLAIFQELLERWLTDDAAQTIDEKTNLLTDIGIDSVGILQLVLAVENKFNIKVKDYELDSDMLSSIGNFLDMIERKRNENN